MLRSVARDMVQIWYVTFHGGGAASAWNNVHRFSADGQALGKALAVESLSPGVKLRELRGFAFGPDGDLYIANAYKEFSQVLRFGGEPDHEGKHPFREVFVAQHKSNPGLAHPFDVAFGPDGHLFVPSQDTNVVGRYFGPGATEGVPGTPAPHPPALRDISATDLLPGTFVPSQKHAAHGVRTVRRAIFGPDGDLFVADRDTDRVKRYDGRSGALRREYAHHRLAAPVHLAFRPGDGALLVGSRARDEVFALDTETGELSPLIAPGAGGLQAPAGMAFGPDGKLYVCSREGRQVLRFDAETGEPDAQPFLDDLEDFPEFIGLGR
jgi:hypothetical protein